ncbi:MAG: Ig-like domain-containing protein, partial [Acetobacteraceae bacterium]
MRWPFDQGTPSGPERLRNRHERRRAKRVARTVRKPTPLLFETLEQRLLLSGTPVPIGTVLATDTAPAIVQDADGTQLDMSVTGAGHWQVVQGATAPEVTFTATTAASNIVLKTSGGDGRFLIGGLEVDSAAASLTGTGIDLQGFLNLKAGIGTFSLGDLAAASTASFIDSNGRFDTDALVLGTSSAASLTVQGGGRLVTEPHDGSGSAAEIAAEAGSGGSQATVTDKGSLWQVGGTLVVGGAADGTLSISDGGAVVAEAVVAGQGSGGIGFVSVAGAGSRLSTTGTLTIGEAGTSTLSVADHGVVTATDAIFGNLKDSSAVINLTGTGAILDVAGTLTLGGAGSATLVLGQGATLSVGSLKIGAGGVLISKGGSIAAAAPAAAPTLSMGLANQTGNKATTDSTITGNVGSAAGLATLRVGLGATPVTDYVDITDKVAADGTFTLTPAQVAALNGGSLPDGTYTLHVVAVALDGRTATTDTTFTLDTAAPTISSFALAPSSETGGAGSNISAYARVALGGVAEQGVSLTMNGKSVVAGAGGVFQIPDVDLVQGENHFVLTATNAAGLSTTANLTVTRQGIAGADVALTWNDVALEICRAYNLYPTDVTRVLAMVGLAQYDTLAAIEGTPSFTVKRTATGPIDTPLALAQAAYSVLVALFPAQKQVADDALAPTLAAVADATTKANSIALGQDIGSAMVAIRANDGSDTFVSFPGGTDLGEWSPTAPAFLVAENPQWPYVTPFAMSSAADYIAPPPPDIASAEWAASYNEIISLGDVNSTTRTADQTEQALFWADGGGSSKPPGHWNLIAQQVAQQMGNSLSANVRLFAQLNVALADAGIAGWLTKYTYDTWRPIQAAEDADLIGNPLADSVPGWQPLLVTPAHPEYVSGHSTFSGAAAAVLIAAFGDNVSFSDTSENLPGVTRNFTSFTQAADEAGRSRIYGGIHFEFSNANGRVLGDSVAQAVMARFALTEDTQGPTVVAGSTPAVTKTNITLTGQIVDNLSGVASATFQVDNGSEQALTLDAQGNFSITTALTLDGTADGAHTIYIRATDVAGNVAGAFARAFTLDTTGPDISLPSLGDGAILDVSSRLTGTADPTGSNLVALSYRIDGGVVHPIGFDIATGTFDDPLPVANLDIGDHTIVITAQDAGGNVSTLSRTVTVAALAPFAVTGFTPDEGAVDVGVTQRPKIEFSRAVNAATLTAANFYATGPGGAVLATTIVPASDGSYAWLFFNDPMPGGSTITVHVVGSGIRAAADGTFLDADNAGNGSSTLTFSFTTVSTVGVANTKLVGQVVDPGNDGQPMTFDDTRRGPDGVPHTPDDVYLNPIVHARISIIGMSTVVYTDANGYFELDDVPAGDVKLVIDGRTATNAPPEYFWPEMVMDLTIKTGVTNTPMSSMGTVESQVANVGILGTFLPRVATSVLQTVDTTGTTTITTSLDAAPTLTEEQRGNLTLTVQAGTALGEDGKPLDNVQIGVATVDPQLVKDMLPPGVLEHTFDITIQAPGVATFSAPVEIKFPNVFNAAPGTKLSVLSFDHTTGRLVINGTATVSADGKYAISDPGQGVIAPGWHGLTPPGDCGGAGGPPAPPPPPTPNDTYQEHDPESLPLITGESGSFSRSWTAPDPLPGTNPGPPANPGDCPSPPPDPPGQKQPFLTVTIAIEGPLAEFMKATGNLPATSQSFTLTAGAGNTKTFTLTAKTFAELLPGGFKSIEANILYGSKIRITEARGQSDGSTKTDVYTYFLYRFLDTTDDQHADGTMSFAQTIADGGAKTYRANPLTMKVGGGDPSLVLDSKTNFFVASNLGEIWFDPLQTGDNLTAGIDIKNPLNGKSAGQIKVAGKGVQEQGYFIDQTTFETLLADMATDTKGVKYPSLTATDRALIDTKAERDNLFSLIQAQTTAIFTDGQLQSGIFESSSKGANILNIAFVQGTNPTPGNGWPLGGAIGALTQADVDLAALVDLQKNAATYSQHQRAFLTAKYVNNQLGGNINFYLDNFFEGQFGMDTNAEIKFAFGMNDAHEIGHHLGLFHTGTSSTVYVYSGAGGDTDIMRQGLYLADTQK